MTREEYTTLDVEDYFNYMGMLAAEVSPASPPQAFHPPWLLACIHNSFSGIWDRMTVALLLCSY